MSGEVRVGVVYPDKKWYQNETGGVILICTSISIAWRNSFLCHYSWIYIVTGRLTECTANRCGSRTSVLPSLCYSCPSSPSPAFPPTHMGFEEKPLPNCKYEIYMIMPWTFWRVLFTVPCPFCGVMLCCTLYYAKPASGGNIGNGKECMCRRK